MRYLFDTDHLSYLQRRSGKEYETLAARLARHSPADFAVCVVSFHEQAIGAHTYINRARKPADVERGYRLFAEILAGFRDAPVLPFDAAAAELVDNWRSQSVRVATMDLRIAAIAVSRGLVLLTRNGSDFSRVPNVTFEDWTV